jgi:hypothetical protein
MDWFLAGWHRLAGLATDFGTWLDRPEVSVAFWPAIVAGLVLLLIPWLFGKVFRGLGRFPSLMGDLLGRRRTGPLDAALAAYRANLAARTFEIRHAWMKDGQTLGEIMVPVSVELLGDGGGIENLPAVLVQVFSAARTAAPAPDRADGQAWAAPRIAIVGGPGSGKSVAMRLIARDGWELPRPGPVSETVERPGMVPVLLSFADLRDAGLDLPKALATSLVGRGLVLPPDSNGSDPIPAWVAAALADGRLLVLIDALDELDRADRAQAARALNAAIRAWPRAPFVVTCRTAAWQDQIEDPRRIRIDMAPFHPAAIRQFVRRWRFEPPKSADELLRVVARQPHVAELARNPLMLTIVCFLYDQPKYRLPDNRAQFYEVCSRALLEEWDQTQSRDRANWFDRPHKEHLLAALAFAHIAGEDPGQDIDEDWALALLAGEMERGLGLERSGNHKLLEELVQNAGLLVRLPPNGLRFPHQTFLEFFAASHLLDAGDLDGMLGRYTADPGRWREVLLLYCGLCTQQPAVSRILDTLLDRGELGLALTALTEARVVDPIAAGRVLDAAERALAGDPEPQVIASLGYLAANPLTTYGPRAADLLHGLLRERAAGLPAASLQELLLAALRRPSAEATTFLIDNLERLDLGRILPAMAEDALLVSAAVLRQTDIALAKRREWIDGLRRAQAVAILLDLDAQTWQEPGLEQAVAVALARCSTLDDFWTLADRPAETPDDAPDACAEDAEVLKRWGWPYEPPTTDQGRLLCCRLARHLSREVSRATMEGVHSRLGYLACALAVERNRGAGWDWESAKTVATWTPGVLGAIWRRAADERWARWVVIGDDSII